MNENTERDCLACEKKSSMVVACAFFLLLMNVLLGLSLFFQLDSIQELQTSVNEMKEDIRTLADNTLHKPKYKQYKLIDYTWETPSSMEWKFKNALAEGYEPAGLVCLNSLKGGMFLFVKRE